MILKILLFIVAGFGLIFGYIKYLENHIIFFPEKGILLTPSSLNLYFEDIYIPIKENIKINGWFIPHLQQSSVSLEQEGAGFIPVNNAKYTVLFLHGNAGNISTRLDKIQLLGEIGVNIFIIDYQGYGQSQGKPSEEAIYLDTQAAYDYLVNSRNIKPEQIILYGESLGAAAAVNLASEVEIKAMILEGGFTRGRDMSKRLGPFLPAFLFPNMFDSLSKIKKVKSPILFIHSPDDEMVPINLAKKLYNAASGLKEFVEISGSHNTAVLDSSKKFIDSISAFIDILERTT
jgi:fermentation-respiration switch protein FrsA (DUF1100 family)